jgi:hypothetical protein
VGLEQHFIDTLKPNLNDTLKPNINVDLVASSYVYHEPMSQEMRDKLRKQRGTHVYMYNVEDFTLIYVFHSKQHAYSLINIHHTTLGDCLNLGNIHIDTFIYSLDILE